ncbi:MAG TPA: Rne/Rng family ribonuclease [Halanaerobiales bacterium]|nr:Rne/Rng family ribonuclease [Halanaerobiales bacterium]
MAKQIIINSNFSEKRAAVLKNNKLEDIFFERESYDRIAGNIYRAAVRDVLPGMQAAFVDIGLEKNAFLHISDLYPRFNKEEKKKWSEKNLSIKNLLQPGEELMVQVEKEPIGTKGPKVTCKVSLPGRYFVLLPYENKIGVSRRINESHERNRLKRIAGEISDNKGVIVRTNAYHRDRSELQKDFNYLMTIWRDTQKRYKNSKAPKLLYRDVELIKEIARDHLSEDTKKVVIDDSDDYNKLKQLASNIAPEVENRIYLYDKDLPIFTTYGIEKELDKALKRKVWLDSGGYVIFDSTEALVSVDVNTGKYTGSKDLQDTVFRTNLEAAKEIARQLRLRDIGGIIIIDFIDMEKEHHQREVLDVLEKELAKDRTKTAMLGLTRLGLVEMTRKKVRERFGELLQKECPYCKGTGKVLSAETMALRVRRKLHMMAVDENVKKVQLELHPDVVAVFRKPKRKLKELEKELDMKIKIKGNNSFHIEDINIISKK